MINHFRMPKKSQSLKENIRPVEGFHIKTFVDNKVSFIPNLLVDDEFELFVGDAMDLLKRQLGDVFYMAISEEAVNISSSELPEAVQSPVRLMQNGKWLKGKNVVSINVNKVDSFWGVLKYVLTLPKTYEAIHLSPIFECSGIEDIHSNNSWYINPNFYSIELGKLMPHLNTVEKQLKAVINLLHALGKTVGITIMPHTSIFSEITLSNPHFFEWVKSKDKVMAVMTQRDLQEEVKDVVLEFLKKYCPAYPLASFPEDKEVFFSTGYGEAKRNAILFGKPNQVKIRRYRLIAITNFLLKRGYQLLNATELPQHELLNNKIQRICASKQYQTEMLTKSRSEVQQFEQSMAISQYRLYEQDKHSEPQGALNAYQNRTDIWAYLIEHYMVVQKNYSFDFIKGDIAHNPTNINKIRERNIVKSVQYAIQQSGVCYCASLADNISIFNKSTGHEDNYYYISAIEYDAIIGIDNRSPNEIASILPSLQKVVKVIETPTPARFLFDTIAQVNRNNEELQLFMGLFVTDSPSFTTYNFQSENVYKFAVKEGFGSFVPKTNKWLIDKTNQLKQNYLSDNILNIQLYASKIWDSIKGKKVEWLMTPNDAENKNILAWTQADEPSHVFVVNLNDDALYVDWMLPAIKGVENSRLTLNFSNYINIPEIKKASISDEKKYGRERLFKGECRVYLINKILWFGYPPFL
jgi:hypothetical protein